MFLISDAKLGKIKSIHSKLHVCTLYMLLIIDMCSYTIYFKADMLSWLLNRITQS